MKRPFRYPNCSICGHEVTEPPLRCTFCRRPVHQKEGNLTALCFLEHLKNCQAAMEQGMLPGRDLNERHDGY
jgi:hypothetical protein